MSASRKAQHPDDLRLSALPRPTAPPALQIAAKPVRLDFAANPNHYRVSQKARESKPRQAGIDRSPRLLLECDTSQAMDPDFGE